MNRPDTHPASELLDKLRAGLLDDTPEKTAIEAHLAHCSDCQRHYDLPSLMQTSNAGVDQKLDQMRRQALAAPRVSRTRRLAPLAAAAALALVAVALFNLIPIAENDPAQIAGNSSEVPALYEDLDFYLWLADHKDPGDSST